MFPRFSMLILKFQRNISAAENNTSTVKKRKRKKGGKKEKEKKKPSDSEFLANETIVECEVRDRPLSRGLTIHFCGISTQIF